MIRRAVELLRDARTLLDNAGAPRATAATRRAMKSAEGAVRHAERLAFNGAPPSKDEREGWAWACGECCAHRRQDDCPEYRKARRAVAAGGAS